MAILLFKGKKIKKYTEPIIEEPIIEEPVYLQNTDPQTFDDFMITLNETKKIIETYDEFYI